MIESHLIIELYLIFKFIKFNLISFPIIQIKSMNYVHRSLVVDSSLCHLKKIHINDFVNLYELDYE